MNSFSFIMILNGAVFGSSLILSYLLGFFCIHLSYRFECLDNPSEIKNHQKPIPFLGGVSVFFSFWIVIFFGIWVANVFDQKVDFLAGAQQILSGVIYLTPKILSIFLGGLVILLVGFFDDRFRWSPLQKMLGQILAVAILMSTGLRIDLVINLGAWGYLATFVWALLIINAFNFIDSLDGHCAGIALISSLIFFWVVQIIHQPLGGLLLITFAGALAGFLIHNFKPAKIFLGDNGSLFVGYMMAAFTLLCRYHRPTASFATSFIPVLIFGVPIYDTLSVVVVRLWRGIPPWQGDRNHFAHRLVKIGMSEKVAVLFSYFVAFTIGNVAILSTQVNFFGAIIIGVIFVSVLLVIAFMEFYVTKGLHIERRA